MTTEDSACSLEKEGLLAGDYHDGEETGLRLSPTASRKRQLLTYIYIIFLHFALVITCWRLFGYHRSASECSRTGSFSPASEAIETEVRENKVFDHTHKTKYAGEPTQENVEAWDALLLPTYFTISESDLRTAGETISDSVKLESGGYAVATNAYHELHCIRQLRLYLYKDTHYPNITVAEDDYLRGHLDHCLEVLREEVMCSGDTSVISFFWHDPPGPKPGSKSNSKRTCINWERLEKWSMEHMVPLDAAVEGGSKPLWTNESEELG